MIAIFYFLIWRPQSQRQKQLRQAVDNLRRGDTVVTAGGILGKVVKAAAADEAELRQAQHGEDVTAEAAAGRPRPGERRGRGFGTGRRLGGRCENVMIADQRSMQVPKD